MNTSVIIMANHLIPSLRPTTAKNPDKQTSATFHFDKTIFY